MHTKKLLLLFLVFVFPVTIYSQSDYRKAILVNNTSDTLNGFIQYNSLKQLSQKIYFKKDFNSVDAIEYSPSQIKEFVFVGWNEKYRSITSKESKPIFAKVLVEGNASLYLTNNDFYVGNEKYGIRAFYNRIPEAIANKKNLAHGRLNFYLNDCIRLKGKVMNVKFTSEELTKLILEYNMCFSSSTERATNSSSKIYNLKESYKLKINTIISASYTTLTLHNYNIDGEKLHSSGSISPEIGIELEHLTPKFSEFISFVTGMSLGYESFLIQNNYTNHLKTKFTKIYSSNTFIEFPIYVKTTYNTNKYGFNTGLGISHRIVISSNIESNIQEVKDYTSSTYSYTTDEFKPFYGTKTFLLFQLGMSIPKGFLPKSSINFRYMRGFGTDEYSAVMTKYSLNYIIEL